MLVVQSQMKKKKIRSKTENIHSKSKKERKSLKHKQDSKCTVKHKPIPKPSLNPQSEHKKTCQKFYDALPKPTKTTNCQNI